MLIGKATALFFLFLFFAGHASASSWRCGTDIVKVGDSSAQVLLKCGEPTYAEEAASIKSGTFRSEQFEPDERFTLKEGTYTETKQKVEHWYYDRGSHDFIYVLTFIGGRLVNIKTAGYGTQKGFQESLRRNAPSDREERDTPVREDAVGRPVKEAGKTGKIDLVGYPAGAKVYLDEHYVGTIPCTLDSVEPGSYEFLVRQEAFKDWREKILVRADTTTWLAVYLEPEKREAVRPEEEPPQARQLYKWADETGRIHITDSPPPNAPN